MRGEVCKRSHAGALLAEEDAESECQTLAVRGLEELAGLEAFGGAELFGKTGLDLVELGLNLGTCVASALYSACHLLRPWPTIISSHPLQALPSLVIAALLRKPAYGFRES